MAITATQVNPLNLVRMASGRYHDTAAAEFTITCGFKPRYVKVVNVDATGLSSMEWFEGMANDSCVETITNGTITVDTTEGITVSASGFTVAVNTEVVIADEQLTWIALG